MAIPDKHLVGVQSLFFVGSMTATGPVAGLATTHGLSISGFSQNYKGTLSAGVVDGAFTAEIFIKMTAGNLGSGRIFSFGKRFAIAVKRYSGQNSFSLLTWDGVSRLAIEKILLGDAIVDGVWNHITITYNEGGGLGFKMYVNKVLKSTSLGAALPSSSVGDPILMGLDTAAEAYDGASPETNPLLATFTEARIYNKALSQAEINAQWSGSNIYAALPADANLAAIWPMNEAVGNTVSDLTTSTDAWLPLMHLYGGGLTWVSAAIPETHVNGYLPLTKIRQQRTEGLEISDEIKSEWLVGLDKQVATSVRTVSLPVRFYNDTLAVYNFANNCPISATGFNTSSDFDEKYVVCIVDTVPNSDKCYIMYDVNCISGRKINYNKDKPTACPVTIEGNKRNPDDDLLFRGTFQEIQTKLGTRNPFA